MTARALRAFRDADGSIFDHLGAIHRADALIMDRLEREARCQAAPTAPARSPSRGSRIRR